MARLLHADEVAVLRAIFIQRAKSQWSSIFEYDLNEAQIFLDSIDAFSEYDLEKDKQYEIINRLTDEGIIKTDYLVNVEFINNYRAACKSGMEPIKSEEKYFWFRNTKWARDHYGPDKFTTMDEVGKKHDGALVINMTTTDIRRIKKQYIANHTVQLSLKVTDKENGTLLIKFDDENWRDILCMKKTTATYKILLRAYLNFDNPTRTTQKYLESQVFAKNRTVLALNPLLIELGKNTITFKRCVEITPVEFKRLKKALKIA